MRKPYPTDLSDAEWRRIEPHLPTPRAAGLEAERRLTDLLQHFAVKLNHVVLQACRCLCERALWEGRGSFQVHRFIERADWFNFTASRCEFRFVLQVHTCQRGSPVVLNVD